MEETYKFSDEPVDMVYVEEGDYDDGAVVTLAEEGVDDLVHDIIGLYGEDSVEPIDPGLLVIDQPISEGGVDDLAARDGVKAVSLREGLGIPDRESGGELDDYLSP